MTPKPRSIKQYGRGRPARVPKPVTWIVCEGERTEPEYFTYLKTKLGLREPIHIKRGNKETDPFKVVKRAKTIRDGSTKEDVIWCVIDVEGPERYAALRKAIKAIGHRPKSKAQISLVLSNPCFEFWYLLHFERTAHYMQSNDELYGLLKTHYPNYSKSGRQICGDVFDKTEIAIENSKAILREKGCSDNLIDCNPSTHVHLVVEALLAMKENE